MHKLENKIFLNTWLITIVIFSLSLIIGDSFSLFDSRIFSAFILIDVLIGTISFFGFLFLSIYKYPILRYLFFSFSILVVFSIGLMAFENNNESSTVKNTANISQETFSKDFTSDKLPEQTIESPKQKIVNSPKSHSTEQQPIEQYEEKQEYGYYSGDAELNEIMEDIKDSDFKVDPLPKIPEYKAPPVPKKIKSPDFNPRVCIMQNGILVCNHN